MTACYAVQDKEARGRQFSEEESATRSPWQRDRDRVLHSAGFRTLQYKTQVFLNHEGDFFRTRLTHSLEVAQISRSIARALGVNEDLAEVIALAHDLGHTPFGHAGEDALQEAMAPWGGFDHNVQSLRQVTEIESRYHGFNGLNLTWESLEGLAKHHGPVRRPSAWLKTFDERYPQEGGLLLKTHASVEAQIAAICDDIAYHGHDLDDGLRAGLLSLDDIEAVPLLNECLTEARSLDWSGYSSFECEQRIRHETVRRVINRLVSDLTERTRLNLAELAPTCADDVRYAGKDVVAFSPAMARKNKEIRIFLYANMYRHWRVVRMARKARLALGQICTILGDEPQLLPPPWREKALHCQKQSNEMAARRVVADFIAGMTDRFAMEEHRRLMDLSVLG
ncbi:MULTISPECIES: deoxyguanosinetriphosphate triphosphohydrolase [unclassified Saccharibacter]|uniref:deoxyguanosinetriphosphate triphosphohydrolase n=1 Tax=unclassified Saccharibacter TaxID=2648722 RepID=UPI00132CBFD0|nr:MULTISPECIES: deoxyguanosinetriphosphate triphosphohydrolase [unclassified Saccharibacter]MXV36087.1 deoxyguanosinetriphosphate triphosphohydrolase [Saccharibacter sp. EH611]MXV56946.1 deoxyguanosinetriphosphate triphosphohydrolase [Saccharibacter sp. EH70]MXV66694.1 deoxyguanosinetriphosphate triphosphohydrolase [Saccharibacter sp. EH60]